MLPAGTWGPRSAANLRFLVSERCLSELAGIPKAIGKLLAPTPCSLLLGGKAVAELFYFLLHRTVKIAVRQRSSQVRLPRCPGPGVDLKIPGGLEPVLRVRTGPAGPQRASGDRRNGGRLAPRLGRDCPFKSWRRQREKRNKTRSPERLVALPVPHSAPAPGPACRLPPPQVQGAPRSAAHRHGSCQNRNYAGPGRRLSHSKCMCSRVGRGRRGGGGRVGEATVDIRAL